MHGPRKDALGGTEPSNGVRIRCGVVVRRIVHESLQNTIDSLKFRPKLLLVQVGVVPVFVLRHVVAQFVSVHSYQISSRLAHRVIAIAIVGTDKKGGVRVIRFEKRQDFWHHGCLGSRSRQPIINGKGNEFFVGTKVKDAVAVGREEAKDELIDDTPGPEACETRP